LTTKCLEVEKSSDNKKLSLQRLEKAGVERRLRKKKRAGNKKETKKD
jgi:hypothetical protein